MLIATMLLAGAAMALAAQPTRPSRPPAGEQVGARPKTETWTKDWQCDDRSPPSSITVKRVEFPPASASVTLISLTIKGTRVSEARLKELRNLLSQATGIDRVTTFCGRTDEVLDVQIFQRVGTPPRPQPWSRFYFKYDSRPR
jgi:hypothetical protein